METPIVKVAESYEPNAQEQALLDVIQAEINEGAAQFQAVLKAIAKANKLSGQWNWDSKKFVKAGE